MILFQNKDCLKNFIIGIIFCLIGVLIITMDPLSLAIKDQFRISPGKYLYNIFKKPHVEALVNIYVFNITNAAAFLSGADKKLKVEEVGPYVFREFQEHRNATLNANGTFSYVIHRSHIAVPEKSIGDAKTDIIFAPNTILLGASSVAARHSKFAAVGFKVLANSLDSKPILNMSVHDYLWGYEDKLLKLASNILPSLVTFDKFGILDRMFDEGHDRVTIHLPQSPEISKELFPSSAKEEKSTISVETSLNDVEYEDEEVDYNETIAESSSVETAEVPVEALKKSNTIRPYSIDSWNGSPILPHFEHLKNHPDEKMRHCARVQGGFDGTLFFKNVTKREKLRIFRRAFCRLLPVYFSNATKIFGLDAYYYELSENAFYDRADDPDTCCFCQDENSCLRKGLGNLSPCYFGIPLAVSQPHFYNGDPTLLDEVDGLHPIAVKHQSITAIQPQMGVPMRVFLRIQLNVATGDLSSNDRIEKLGNTVLPIFWVEFILERLPEDIETVLKAGFVVLPYVQAIFAVAFVIVGIVIVIFSLVPRKKTALIEKNSSVQPLLIRKVITDVDC